MVSRFGKPSRLGDPGFWLRCCGLIFVVNFNPILNIYNRTKMYLRKVICAALLLLCFFSSSITTNLSAQFVNPLDELPGSTGYTTQNQNGPLVVNDTKVIFEYDNQNRRTAKITQQWDGAAWVNVKKEDYQYNGFVLTYTVISDWDGAAWAVDGQYCYTIDPANQVVQVVEGDLDGGVFDPWYVTDYTYDHGRRPLTCIKRDADNQQVEDSKAWTYTPTGQPLTYTHTNRRGRTRRTVWRYRANETKPWRKVVRNPNRRPRREVSRTTYTYDAQCRVQKETIERFDRDVNRYIFVRRICYSYDQQGRLIERVVQSRNRAFGTWVNRQRETSTYDANGRLTQQEQFTWDDQNGVWDKVGHTQIDYPAPRKWAEDIATQESISVLLYPNPVVDQLHVRSEAFANTAVRVTILNVEGRAVRTTSLQFVGNEARMEGLASLPAGAYWLRLEGAADATTLRFVVQ